MLPVFLLQELHVVNNCSFLTAAISRKTLCDLSVALKLIAPKSGPSFLMQVKDFLQLPGIFHGISTKIIVKIEEGLRVPFFYLISPKPEFFFCIIRGIKLFGTVEADIYKISGDLLMIGIAACGICNTEGHVMLLKDRKESIIDPGRMSNL